ncbi:RNA ligase family protein [Streptomyces sp. NPDC059650]|uniref:RNA ligase family protein n=1 Tax=Streptomyces sp. NPDC059650 TaxID=3346896 RepID=UPI0036A1BEB6
MRTQYPRYPRTPHLPGSPGATADDEWADWDAFVPEAGARIVMTLKMDGENTTVHRDGMYARSPSGRSWPWQDEMRAHAAAFRADIPPGWFVCGENLTVTHSLHYTRPLPQFMVFSVWAGDTCLSWADTTEWAELLGLATVPVLYEGPRLSPAALHQVFEASTDTDHDEGYVVRDAGAFARPQFGRRVAKWVRPGHVTTGRSWPLQAAV